MCKSFGSDEMKEGKIMADLIDRQMLLDELKYLLDEQEVEICDASFIAAVLVEDLIKAAPAIGNKKRGTWNPVEKSYGGIEYHMCSVCGISYMNPEFTRGDRWDYCPSCGAKMDE